MSFIERISADIKTAMLAREKEKLAALRDIKSKLLLEATSGSGVEVSDEVGLKICSKLYKQRMESYDLFKEQGREDLASDELFQAEIIQAYLPKMLTDDEVKAEVANAIAELGASSMKDMGKVMGVLSSKLAGKADGKVISDFVKQALNS